MNAEEQYWVSKLEAYAENPKYYNKIVLLDITEENLKALNPVFNVTDVLDYGDWHNLYEILPYKEAETIKSECLEYEKEISDNVKFHRTILYSDMRFITQIISFSEIN